MSQNYHNADRSEQLFSLGCLDSAPCAIRRKDEGATATDERTWNARVLPAENPAALMGMVLPTSDSERN